MRQRKIDRNAAQRLEDQMNASVQKALDKIRIAVQESLDEAEANRSDRTSE